MTEEEYKSLMIAFRENEKIIQNRIDIMIQDEEEHSRYLDSLRQSNTKIVILNVISLAFNAFVIIINGFIGIWSYLNYIVVTANMVNMGFFIYRAKKRRRDNVKILRHLRMLKDMPLPPYIETAFRDYSAERQKD